MPDREKVVEGMERCLKHTCPAVGSKEYLECEYTVGRYCRQDILMRDALALLKEQEPVEPKRILSKCGGMTVPQYRCGVCEGALFVGAKYCPNCGRAVKWE